MIFSPLKIEFTWEIGRGSTWTEAARDLVKKIYDVPGPEPILH
jgi:hypothetical protein